MKIAIFTSSALRHQAFAKIAYNSNGINVVAIFHEEGNILKGIVENRADADIELQHLKARDQTEKDYFELYLNDYKSLKAARTVPRQWFSTGECIDTLKDLEIDLILVYGTSIIKGNIIDEFRGKILNVHLGLSPYYRGSGTNYFPFVNNEPEYCGATFMYLDEGIDTGEIIHQIRPNILSTDSFHQLSNRFLLRVFKTYVMIAEQFKQLGHIPPINTKDNCTRKFYRRKDFTSDTVNLLYQNFFSGMIQDYLVDYENRIKRVPIITNPAIQTSL